MSYRLPSAREKSRYVRAGFDAIAHRYDLFNDLITQGQHRLWKRSMIRRMGLDDGARVLDLCCGTGDIAHHLGRRLSGAGRVLGLDFSINMLREARRRAANDGRRGGGKNGAAPLFLGGDATRLPFADGVFDGVTIGYGLRNVTDLAVCLEEIFRILRPGGVMASLDVGKVRSRWLRPLADFYFFRIVPWIGNLLQPGEEMYRYLPHSSVDYPHQDRLREILESRGFAPVELIEFLGGASALHIARKPGSG